MLRQREINRTLGEDSQSNAVSMLSRSLPSCPSPLRMTLKRSSSAILFERGIERGIEVFKVASGMSSLDAYEKKINVLSEVIKMIVGPNEKIEDLLKNDELVVDDFKNALQRPNSQSEEAIETYEEIVVKIIQLEKLENDIREKKSQVETLRSRLGLINQRREEEEEDRKGLENEIDDLEKNLRKVERDHVERVRELEGKIRVLEEMELIDNGIIDELEENKEELEKDKKELQKELNLKTSEINTLDRRLGSKIDDNEILTATISDSVDACALFYKEKMLCWLESDLKKTGDNLKNKFNCLKQLLEPNRKTKTDQRTDQRWQKLFKSFDAYYQNLENLLSEKQQEIESRLKELKEQEYKLLQEKSQLEQEVKNLKQQIIDLRKEKGRLLETFESLAFVELEKTTKKIEELEKYLADKAEERRLIEEKLNKNKIEQEEFIENKKILSNKHQEIQKIRNERREKGWSRPQMMKNNQEKEKEETKTTKTIAHQISDNNLKGKSLQKEQVDLKEQLIKICRENEENFQQKIRELNNLVDKLSHEKQLYLQLHALEKQLNSAKLKISERNLNALLDIYKEEGSKKAKEELNKELSEKELEAILNEVRVKKEIKEMRQQLITFQIDSRLSFS